MAHQSRFSNVVRRRSSWPLALGVAALLAATVPPVPQLDARGPDDEASTSAAYGRVPLSFEANAGQVDQRAAYVARGAGFTLLLESAGASTVVLRRDERGHKAAAVRLSWPGARAAAQATGMDAQPGTVNYLRGRDPAAWRRDIPTFGKVAYDHLYPGIDLVYYGNHRELEYDLIVAPGASTREVVMAFDGADRLEVAESGDLILHIGARTLYHRKPIAYQFVGGMRQDVPAWYEARGDTRVTFGLGAYDRALPLVIDPVVVYSTYLNGSNDEEPFGIEVDQDGFTYVAGRTLSADFPIVPGAYDDTHSGGYGDVFVTKLDATGASLVYSTVLGGSGDDGGDASLAIDASGYAYVSGRTSSSDFPTTAGALDQTLGGSTDAFVTKLNPMGSGLVYSSYLGGSSDDWASGLALDGAGRVYLRGTTMSSDFPTTAGAYDQTFNGGWVDAFVAKFDATGSALLFSTFLGGSNNDGLRGSIAIDLAGNAYVTGYTDSADFPTTVGAYDTTFTQFSTQAYVAKLGLDGDTLVYSTFIKGNHLYNGGHAIAVDTSGAAHVTSVSQWNQGPTNAGQALISKLDPLGSTLVYSVSVPGHFRWGAYDYWTTPNAIRLDETGAAYVVGATGALDFPTTVGAWDRSYNQPSFGSNGSAYDAFLLKLAADGSIVYSTFIGGSGEDIATGVALGLDGDVYLAGHTASGRGGTLTFPTTAGAFDTTWTDSFSSPAGPWRSAYAGFVMRMDLAGAKPANVSVEPASAFTVLREAHCVNATITDSNSQPVPDAPAWFKLTRWFGNGGTSNVNQKVMTDGAGQATFCHTAQLPGVYTFDVWADSNKDRFQDADEPTGSASQSAFFGVDPVVGVYGGTAVLSAVVFDGTFGGPGRSVTFTVLGQPAGTVGTDAAGMARLTAPLVGVAAGVYPGGVVASFNGDGSLPAAVASATLTVNRATPIVTWNPAMIQAGTAIGSAQLNASASTPGVFAYSMPPGTVFGAGAHTVTAWFTPTDGDNYNPVTLTRDISANIWTDTSMPTTATLLGGTVSAPDPTRNRVYVGRYFGLDVLDATTHQVLASTDLPLFPADIAIDIENQRLLMVEHGRSWLYVYDTATLAQLDRIDLHPATGFPAVAMDGASGLVWVGNASVLQAVDLSLPGGDPGRVQTLANCGSDVAVNTTTGLVYAACWDGVLRVIDGNPSRPTFGQTIGSVTVSAQPAYYASVAVDVRRGEVYVGMSNPDSQPATFTTVAIIQGDPAKPTFHTRIGTLTPTNLPGPLPEYMHPTAIAVNTVTGRVYVMASDLFGYSDGSAVLNVFDAASRTVAATVYLPHVFDYSLGHLAVNPATNVIYVGGYGGLAVQDTIVEEASTPTGSNVSSAMTAASLTFTNVTSGGTTSVSAIDAVTANLTLPGQFSIEGAPAYDITTSASYTGPITLCFAVAIDDPDVFAGLVILHGVNGEWVPKNTIHDFANRQVCATVASLSPFVVGRMTTSYQFQAIFDTTKAFAGATAPLKVRLLDAGGANVSSHFLDVRATHLRRVGAATALALQGAGQANPDGNFRYDSGLAGYIFNLATKDLVAGTYRLSIRAGADATPKTVEFQIR